MRPYNNGAGNDQIMGFSQDSASSKSHILYGKEYFFYTEQGHNETN